MTSQPPSERPARDRDFEWLIHDHYTRLIDAFVARGFKRKEARLWVGAWRHMDDAADLARTALTFHHLQVPVGQAIPWYWEHIPPDVACGYLPYRWRAAEARRVMDALRARDPTLSRRDALAQGLVLAESGHTPAEALELITHGRDIDNPDHRRTTRGAAKESDETSTRAKPGRSEVLREPR